MVEHARVHVQTHTFVAIYWVWNQWTLIKFWQEFANETLKKKHAHHIFITFLSRFYVSFHVCVCCLCDIGSLFHFRPTELNSLRFIFTLVLSQHKRFRMLTSVEERSNRTTTLALSDLTRTLAITSHDI